MIESNDWTKDVILVHTSRTTSNDCKLSNRNWPIDATRKFVPQPKVSIYDHGVMGAINGKTKMVPTVRSHDTFGNVKDQCFSMQEYKSIVVLEPKPNSKFEEFIVVRKSNLLAKNAIDLKSKAK